MMVRVRRVAPVLLLMVTIPLFAADKAKSKRKRETSSRPPRELHLVRGHWTPYNPPDPATYPATAKSYEIKQGDTLSGIARAQYRNAYLWPQLWESNTWITDAHWIYPGDVLLVQGEGANASVSTQTTTGTTSTTTSSTTARGAATTARAAQTQQGQAGFGQITAAERHREASPIPLGAEADVYCYGYIGDPAEVMPNSILSWEDLEVRRSPGEGEQPSGSAGDLIFIDGGTSTGLVAGETYMVVERRGVISHPHTGALIGQHYDFAGQVKVLCADETQARGIITQNCREVHLGARLKPMPQLPIPIARVPDLPAFCDKPTDRSTGYIIDSKDFREALGEGNLVQVNLGNDDQLQPGDFLTVYRDIPGRPRQVLGEIGILTTQSHTATGRIVGMRYSMTIGDGVEAR
ncbi:MAG: hypothetical protein NVSMB68_03300 [Thermoanaerobaculia bacterium]